MDLIYRHTTHAPEVENRNFSGYGIVFNSDSVRMTIYDPEYGIVEVVERISPESLSDADMSSVIAARNHNFNQILGRTDTAPGKEPTLNLTVDSRGVHYAFSTPDTTYGNDLLESSRRGDIHGSSFVFTMDWDEGYDFEERADNTLVATPKRITKIYEMGPVTNPAYPETTAENRSQLLASAVKEHMRKKAEEITEERQTETPNHEIELNQNWLLIESQK